MADKKINTVTLFLGLIVIASSCQYDDQPNFLLKAHVQTFGREVWAIASDEHGRVLDHKLVLADGVVEFRGSTPGKIIYTTLERTGWGYILNSTQAIPVGTEITADTTTYPYAPSQPMLGNANFTVHDISFNLPSNDPGYILSAVEFGGSYWINTLFGLSSIAYQGSTLTFNFPLQIIPSNVLGIGYREGVPVYQWFNGVSEGDSIDTSFSGFQPCKTIPVNKMMSNFAVVGMYGNYINGGIGYSLSRYGHWLYSPSSDLTKTPMLGYLDGFDNYWVTVNAYANPAASSENVTFDSFGPVPTSINIPDYNYSLTSDGFLNFSFSFSNNYSYQKAFFTIEGKRSSQSNTWWFVNAPAGDRLVEIQIPGDILAKHPDFTTDQLKLNSINLVDELGGDSYAQVFFKPTVFRSNYRTLTYHFGVE